MHTRFGLIFVLGIMIDATFLIGQTTWIRNAHPLLSTGPSGSWEDASVILPYVLKESTGFKMWYYGDDGSTTRIGYATSNDGTTWTKHPGNPVLDVGPMGSWDDASLLDPMVLFDGSNYHMWYGGFDGSTRMIGHALSDDGISWTKTGSNPVLTLGASGSWEDVEHRQPFVILDGPLFRLWYTGADGTNQRFGYATSTDGISWTKYDGNPIMDVGEIGDWDSIWLASPRIIYQGSSFEMFYSAFSEGKIQIGYATSSDGLTWTKFSGNPVLTPGPNGAWDDKFLFVGSVIFSGTSYDMWYTGFDGSTWRIGQADAQAVIISVDYFGNSIRKFELAQNYPNPFNPVTTLRYALPQSAHVLLVIYDVNGREVRRLVDGLQPPGDHQIIWDGSTARGRHIPSGIYIARLVTPEYTRSIKMVLLK